MQRFNKIFLISTIIILILNSCLSFEYKIYTFEFKDRNSGTLTIEYLNIMSVSDIQEGEFDNSYADFEELVFSYLVGDRIESDYPEARIIKKELFEQDNKLNGRVILEFDNLEAVRLYKYSRRSPTMFNVSSAIDGEHYVSSNGEIGKTAFMNIVFFDPKLKTLILKTKNANTESEGISLVHHYRKWQIE